MKKNDAILVAEIGATNARLAMTLDKINLIEIRNYPLNVFSSVNNLFEKYFKDCGLCLKRGIIGVAAPVLEEEVKFTNIDMDFNQKSLRNSIFKKELLVLNDLELQAYGLEAVIENDIIKIGSVKEEKKGSKVLISPGTGLGLAGIVNKEVVFTEGGHLEIPSNVQDFNYIFKKFEKERKRLPTFEDFLSGKGINYIFCYLSGSKLSPYSNEEILINKTDENCIKTRKMITFLLSVYLRYIALIWGATSGVFITGSIANTLLKKEVHSSFRTEFENSMTMKQLLLKIPLYLIKDVNLGLKGGLILASRV